MANSTLIKRYSKFIRNLNGDTIENYFGIINKPETNVRISIIRDGNDVLLDILFEKTYSFDIVKLPVVINEIIATYATDIINIKIKINHYDDYPFRTPVWFLTTLFYNINSPLNLPDYYKYIIDNHNNRFNKCNKDWSPAIDVEKDILEFISKINHFDYLLEL